jgi:hypothetical protein
MVKRYQGGLISANNSPTNISETSGFFNTSQQMQAKQNGLWPQANNSINSTSGTVFTSTRQVISGQVIQYKYHAFLSSSSFVTTGNGIVDILVVSGGGGGGSGSTGSQGGDGGSGGGVVVIYNRSIASNTYTITVGSGGPAGAAASVGAPSAANGSNGTISSVSGIVGANSTGGLFGRGGGNGAAYRAGNGAGGTFAATGTATSGNRPGIGLGVDFFNLVDLSANTPARNFRFDTANGLTYFASGGASTWLSSSSSGGSPGSAQGNAALGGGAGWVTTETFGETGLNATNDVRLPRAAAPNMGGGGASGYRASSSAGPGSAGGSGLVVIRYKI